MKKIKSRIQKNVRTTFLHKIEVEESQKVIKNSEMGYTENIGMPDIQNMPIYGYSLQEFIINNTFLVPSIYTANLHNVIYYPRYNTLFTHDRKLIADTVMNSFRPDKYSLRKLYFSKQERISGFCSVFRSIFNYRNYYHTVIDYIPRLYLLEQYKHKEVEKIKLLVPGNLTKVEDFFLSKFLPENVEIKFVSNDKIFRIENLILPSFLTHKNSAYLPSSYLKYFHDKILPKRPRNRKNLIYISRKFVDSGSTRCVLNEEELLKKLKPYGFKKYSLEEMSIEEQIELFYDANYVIAPHGAGLTNIIFSEKINLLEIFPGSGMLPHYYFLSKALNHNYTYCCSQGIDQNANFMANIDRILQIVKNSF